VRLEVEQQLLDELLIEAEPHGDPAGGGEPQHARAVQGEVVGEGLVGRHTAIMPVRT